MNRLFVFVRTAPVSQPTIASPTSVDRRDCKQMSARRFLLVTGICVSIALAAIVAINVYLDIYGLFRSSEGRRLPVYHNERISKYLLSYNYIPDNYERILIGTSLSANVDLSEAGVTGIRTYNASVMGANVSELKPIIENCIRGGVRQVVFCVSPYMAKTSGAKEVELNSKLYYGALGSRLLLETYFVAMVRKHQWSPSKYPKNQISADGVNRFESLFNYGDVQPKIQTVLAAERNEPFTQHAAALRDLRDIFDLLEKNNVNYRAYFHPVPAVFYHGKQNHYRDFEHEIYSLVPDPDKLINFNADEYAAFTKDFSNYIDHGHFSPNGAKAFSRLLHQRLNAVPH